MKHTTDKQWCMNELKYTTVFALAEKKKVCVGGLGFEITTETPSMAISVDLLSQNVQIYS